MRNAYKAIITAVLIALFAIMANSALADIIYVDLQPLPAEWLQNGSLDTTPNSAFTTRINVTNGVSDNDPTTSYNIGYETINTSTIFSDGFETGNFDYIYWDNKSIDGDIRRWHIQTTEPYSGTYHAQVRDSDDPQNLTLNLTGTGTATLSYYRRLLEFGDGGDYFRVSFNNGTGWQVLEYNNSNDENSLPYLYQEYEINSSGTEFMILFECDVDSGTEYCRLDNVQLIYGSITTNNRTLSGKWDETYNNTLQYFTRIYKDTTGAENFTFRAYDGLDTPSDQYTSCEFSGTGWFNCNTTDLMYYMTVTQGLFFYQVRVYPQDEQNMSELVLRTEFNNNDTEYPQITECTVDDTSLVAYQTARFTCTITDDQDVASALATINETNMTLQKDGGNTWYYDYTCLSDENKTMNYVQATDIFGKTNFTFESVTTECDYTNTLSTCDLTPQLTVPSYPYVDSGTIYNMTVILSCGNTTQLIQNLSITFLNTMETFDFTQYADYYGLSFNFTTVGDYPFVIYGTSDHNNVSNLTGTLLVRDPFYVTILLKKECEYFCIFHNFTDYKNDFAYITAERTDNLTQYMQGKRAFLIIDDITRNTLDLSMIDEVEMRSNRLIVLHGKYTNGQATIKFYEKMNYTLRLIDGDITFPSDTSPPNIKNTYTVDVSLGMHDLHEDETTTILLSKREYNLMGWISDWIVTILIVIGIIGMIASVFLPPPLSFIGMTAFSVWVVALCFFKLVMIVKQWVGV
jgi:hypothetical protein